MIRNWPPRLSLRWSRCWQLPAPRPPLTPRTSSIARCARASVPARRNTSSSKPSPVTKPGRASCSRSMARTSTRSFRASARSRLNSRPASSTSARARCSTVARKIPTCRRAALPRRARPVRPKKTRRAERVSPAVAKLQRAGDQHAARHARSHAVGELRFRRHGRLDRLGHLSLGRVLRPHQGVLRLHRRHDAVQGRRSTITATARTSPV